MTPPPATAWLGSLDPTSFMRDWNDAVSAWQQSWGQMVGNWPTAMPSAMAPPAGRSSGRGRGRGCERCGRERCSCEECDCERCDGDCRCDCCVNDADIVIEARAGERRVISVIVENDTRRPTEVRAELSAFTTRDRHAGEAVKGAVFPEQFTLAACEEHVLTIVFDSEMAVGDRKTAANDKSERIPDVDRCVVYYADLRLEGCPTRPLRIAVALIPRECDAHRMDCGCGCC